MRGFFSSLLIVVVITAGFGVSAFADDLQPPPWSRSHPRATYQRWEFEDAVLPAVPVIAINPNGVAQASVAGGPAAWLPVHDNRVGVWDLATGPMDVLIPNYPDHPDWHKFVWVQVTWDFDAIGVPAITVDGVSGQLVENDLIGPNNSWNHSTWLFELPYNPDREVIRIAGDLRIDELVVDTICIPEPGTLVLVLGGVGLLAARTRRNRIA